MGTFDNVIAELDYQVGCHIAADMLNYGTEEQLERNKELLQEWQEAIKVLKQNQ